MAATKRSARQRTLRQGRNFLKKAGGARKALATLNQASGRNSVARAGARKTTKSPKGKAGGKMAGSGG